MVFDYYHRLPARLQRVYRASDALTEVELPEPGAAAGALTSLESSLARADRRSVTDACENLLRILNRQLGTPPVAVRVLAARPSRNWGELHGLYEPASEDGEARITVWMRTARKKQVVAYRTFLRTVLHELCHHLDYELHSLADSLHTEGFFKRESSLLRQLVVERRPQGTV